MKTLMASDEPERPTGASVWTGTTSSPIEDLRVGVERILAESDSYTYQPLLVSNAVAAVLTSVTGR